jgi:2,3-bisphosphoglycerate-independent phosphoglycerate mutase
LVTVDHNKPLAVIEEDDVVISLISEPIEGRELTEALSQQDFHEQNMQSSTCIT